MAFFFFFFLRFFSLDVSIVYGRVLRQKQEKAKQLKRVLQAPFRMRWCTGFVSLSE